MFRQLRVRGGGVIAALLMSIIALGLPHGADGHEDPDCGVVLVVHDASAHRVHADRSDDHAQPVHCLACHWARSFRSRPGLTFVPVPASNAGAIIRTATVVIRTIVDFAQPPLRSPPISSALA